eukprot:gene29412-36466_t
MKDSPNDDTEECVAEIVKSSKKLTPTRPPIGRQLLDIQKIIDHYHEQLEELKDETECHALFVINAKWLATFMSMASKTSTSLLFGEDEENDANATAIHSIDNTSLVSESSLIQFNAEDHSSHVTGSYALRNDAKLNIDYFLVPQVVWLALCGWYGSIGPALPRLLFEVQTPQMGSEIFLKNSRKFRLFNVECNLASDHHSGHSFENRLHVSSEAGHHEFQTFLHPTTIFSQQQVVNLPDVITHLPEELDNLSGKNSCSNLQAVGSASPRSPQTSPHHTHSKSLSLSGGHAVENILISGGGDSSHSEAGGPVAPAPCVIYCNSECQLAHWQYHKHCCKALIAIENKKCITNYYYVEQTKEEVERERVQQMIAEKEKLANPSISPVVTKPQYNNIQFNKNKNNQYALSTWKKTILSKEQKAAYRANQKATYKLYGRSGKVGLANLGNSCYMNSSVQCISHIMPLTTYFLAQHYKNEINYFNRDGTGGKLIKEYYDLLSDLWFESKEFVSPKAFKSLLGKINPEYAGLQQHDAHEVVELLLDKYHEDLNKIQGPKPYTTKVEGNGTDDLSIAAETWRLHKTRDDSVVHDTVGSLMRSQLTCPDCAKVSVTYDFHSTVQLAIPKTNNRVFTVVFVPEYSVGVEGGVDSIRPVSFTITLDRMLTVSTLTSALHKLINPVFVNASGGNVVLFESRPPPNCSQLSRILKPSSLLSSVTDGVYVFAYCPIKEMKRHVIIYQRFVSPKLAPVTPSASPTTHHSTTRVSVTGHFQTQYVGPPILISIPETFHTARVRHLIWQNTCSLFEEGSKAADMTSHTLMQQFALGKDLSVHLVNNYGEPVAVSKAAAKISQSLTAEQADEKSEKQMAFLRDIADKSSGERYMSSTQQDLWCRAVMKRGYGGCNVEGELGVELTYDKQMTMADFSGNNSDLQFLALDLVGDQFTCYDREYYMDLVKSSGTSEKKITPNGSSKSNQQSNETTYTLYDCLQDYTKEETLEAGNEWYCNVCKEHKVAKKKVSFATQFLPSVLILSLKRFEYRDMGRVQGGSGSSGTHREKISNYIDFPIDSLDLGPYCSSGEGSGGDGDQNVEGAALT